jgi:hypothetical protein
MPDDVLRLRRVEKLDEQLCDDEQFDVGKGADDAARTESDVVDNDDGCAGRKCR